jgi:hypothetical protein
MPPPWPNAFGQSAKVLNPPGRILTNRQRNDLVKRRRTLAFYFPVGKWHTPDDLVVSSGILAKETVSPTQFFDAKYPLTGKNSIPILQIIKSKALSINYTANSLLILDFKQNGR